MSLQNISKKNVLFTSWVIVFGVLLTNQIGISNLCGQSHYCTVTFSNILGLVLLIAIPAAVISTILFFLKDSVFRAWLYLFLIWTPLHVLSIYLSPTNDAGVTALSSRGLVAIYGAGIFLCISLVLILVKSILVYRKK